MNNVLQGFGWWLMGIPTGIRKPWPFMLRFGPYRWGACLYDRYGR